MWRTLSFVLPVLIPSWRFFKTIEPAPQVEWAALASPKDRPQSWQPFRPKPPRTGWAAMLGRLFWNPDQNETLFVISCAERIQQDPTTQSVVEIHRQILEDLHARSDPTSAHHIQFRLRCVHREGDRLVDNVVFTSTPVAIAP